MATKNKVLIAASQKRYYEKNKQKFADNCRIHRQQAREHVAEYKRSHPCPCGEPHEACLVFHHLVPSEKDLEVSIAIQKMWSIKRIDAEIAKCTVLCSNCHLKLHWNERNGFVADR